MSEYVCQTSLAAPEWTREEMGRYLTMTWVSGSRSTGPLSSSLATGWCVYVVKHSVIYTCPPHAHHVVQASEKVATAIVFYQHY